tara:strand:- start:1799 stop:2200 length:402 start_codon:yes stop_codon:yes gene_type:complete
VKKSITIIGGFAGLRESEPFVTTAENKKNTQIVINDWMLGPESPSNEPDANKTFWVAVGKAMQVDETEARRRRCSNCEYYDNSTLTQAKMERIPRNQWDDNAGFRGFCTKFEFICHDLRVCQAWEEREFEFED